MREAGMKCQDVRDLMPDLAARPDTITSEMQQHIGVCRECAAKLAAFRQTMSLLDEWPAPEPSPYFDVRLQARMREEKTDPRSGWQHWLRQPALALCFVVLMALSVTLVRLNQRRKNHDAPPPEVQQVAVDDPGTPVGDLQALDKNHDLYSDFEVLDDLQVQQDVNATP
jgi:hypothetical protein